MARPVGKASAATAKKAPSKDVSALPASVSAVLGSESPTDEAGAGASEQVQDVIRSLEAELRELDLLYRRAMADVRFAPTGGEDDPSRGWLGGLEVQIEEKSRQLSALRRTHAALGKELGSVRDELQRTRGALEQAAETAAARFRRIQMLETPSPPLIPDKA